MRVKPKIARVAPGKWVVRKPLFGFRAAPDETEHTSHADAVASLVDVAKDYASGGSAERGRQMMDQVSSVPTWTPLEYRAS
jgi:hypothetical protein